MVLSMIEYDYSENERKHKVKDKEEAEQSAAAKRLDEVDFLNGCASGDCTGLIPRLPESEDEIDSYISLYTYLPQAISKNEE